MNLKKAKLAWDIMNQPFDRKSGLKLIDQEIEEFKKQQEEFKKQQDGKSDKKKTPPAA